MTYDFVSDRLVLTPCSKQRLAFAALALIGVVSGVVLSVMTDGFVLHVFGSALSVASSVALVLFLWILIRNKSVFEADTLGFSLRGKPQRLWSEFHGVQIRYLHPRLFPSVRWIAVRVGASRRNAQVRHVFPNRSFGSAEDMAAAITDFATEMKRRPAPAQAIQYRSVNENVKTVTPFHKVIEERAARTAAE